MKGGNHFDKYRSAGLVGGWLVRNFLRSVTELADKSGARDIHEVGCGEGELTRRLARPGRHVRGSDLHADVIDEARRRQAAVGGGIDFEVADACALDPARHSAELVVCCEVLEHVPDPARALASLSGVARPHLIVSVPREPVWRALNMARGRYWADLGNTPGHLQHWSSASFRRFIETRFDVIEERRPLPWTVLLCRARS